MNGTYEDENKNETDHSNAHSSDTINSPNAKMRDSSSIQVPGASRIYSRKKLLFVLLLPLLMSLMQVGSVNTVLNTM